MKEGFIMHVIGENAINILLEKDIKPSYIRIKVLDYLITNQNHPTVNQIYTELINEIPTLSKTTVYNSLKLFMDAGIVRVISTEDNDARYDADIINHGHFKCKACGKIYDFPIDIDNYSTRALYGFKVDEKNVYFKGICNKCLEKINK